MNDCKPDCKYYKKPTNEKPCRHCKRLCVCTDYYERNK